jgi:hypothetical protein
MKASSHMQLPATVKHLRATARIPAPVPGRVVSVPLSLWLDYLRVHNLEVVGRKGDTILTRPKQRKDKAMGG